MSTSSTSLPSQKALGVFTLAMINVAAIVSLRNFPTMARQGLACLFFYLVASLIFLIPAALVCAELATMIPKNGGMYHWVKAAFGKRMAFVCVWIFWMITVSFLPALIMFIASTTAYLFDPAWVQDSWFILSIILCVLWGATLVNCFGMQLSGLVSTVGVILGTILPGALLIGLAGYWTTQAPVAFTLSWDALIPNFDLNNLVFLAFVMLGFDGMELTALHANDVQKPQTDYPRSIAIATVLIVTLSILGSLAIATVVPQQEISLVAGIMQSFKVFFEAFNMRWATNVLAVLLIIGSTAGVATWIIGPIKGLFAAKEDGFLPKFLRTSTKKGVPIALLFFQALFISAISILMLIVFSVDDAFLLFTAIPSILICLTYILIFAAALKLRFSHASMLRPYRVGKGNMALWIVAGTGLIGCVIAILLNCVPPHTYTGHPVLYEALLFGALAVLLAPALFYKGLK